MKTPPFVFFLKKNLLVFEHKSLKNYKQNFDVFFIAYIYIYIYIYIFFNKHQRFKIVS